MAKINVLKKEITVMSRNEDDYICITDIGALQRCRKNGLYYTKLAQKP